MCKFDMLKKFILLTGLALLAATTQGNAQRRNNTIEMRRSAFGAASFFRNGERLSLGSVGKYMAEQPEAFRHWRAARRTRTFGHVLGFAGGYLLGYAFGQAIAGVKPATGLLVVGGGLTALSIPMRISFKQRAIIAVDLYNEQISGIRDQSAAPGHPSLRNTGFRMRIPLTQ